MTQYIVRLFLHILGCCIFSFSFFYVLLFWGFANVSIFILSLLMITFSVTFFDFSTRSLDDNSIAWNRSLVWTYPMIKSRNILNIFPCSGFGEIFSIHEVSRIILNLYFYLSTILFTNKWHTLICLEFPVQESLPLFTSLMVICLSWKIIFFLI